MCSNLVCDRTFAVFWDTDEERVIEKRGRAKINSQGSTTEEGKYRKAWSLLFLKGEGSSVSDGRTLQDWLGVSEDKRSGRCCEGREYGEDGRDTKLSQSREHESLDSNQGVIMEARLALEIHEQNITAQNLALDS